MRSRYATAFQNVTNMLKLKYKILLSLICSIVQTVGYSALLWFAYTFWTAKNAGLIIGTIAFILVPLFFLLILIQNLVAFSTKGDDILIIFILIDILWILPFIMNFSWLSSILIMTNIFIFYMTFYVRNHIRKRGLNKPIA